MRVSSDLTDVQVHASVSRGIVRAIIPAGDVHAVSLMLSHENGAALHGGSVVAERLPAPLWRMMVHRAAERGKLQDLAVRVRAAFDPHRVLNRGVMIGVGDD
jgi:FAD/FMN-containing dehydrogenase